MDEIVAIILLIFGSMWIGGAMSREWHRYRARKFWIRDGVVHSDGPISYEDATRICEAWKSSY